jgi:3-phosphoshikimate 1-carboxyvinyltransferase
VQGPWRGGRVSIECPTSQYLSALLLASPLAPSGCITEISVPLLNEKPYIDMTLSYLKALEAPFEMKNDCSWFKIPGGAAYRPLNGPVPADFSSAAFPAAAAIISGGRATLQGLDPDDSQGDKVFFGILKSMGANVIWNKQSVSLSRPGPLHGGTFDLNATPDLLPALAVCAAVAEGDTALVNVAHARIKETDRIAVMAEELARLGVRCTEGPDGLVIHGVGAKGGTGNGEKSPIKGGRINGRGDHRIVMAFAALALGASSPVEIDTAESAAVTYPEFLNLLNEKN